MSSKNPKPRTSKVASQRPNVKASVPTKEIGGGGQNASHGLEFHLNIAMLLLFHLKEMSQTDLGLQYHIWLEKNGYGKFDDIVVRYKKSGGNWIKICVQCKHKQETTRLDGTKTVKEITAHDFLSNENKNFSLAEYVKSFREIKHTVDEETTYYIILSNMGYSNGDDSRSSIFQCEGPVDLREVTDIFGNNWFKIKYNDALSYQISKEMKPIKQDILDLENKAVAEFCDKFLYVCDNRDLEKEFQEKLSKHCNYNEENIKNLKARLYYLVSQMYQHKIDPSQKDFINEFTGGNIFYQIQPACPQFTGRVEEIHEIKNSLEQEKGRHLLDLLVTGMAGMGKTQIVRKYVEEYKQSYQHVIWINAENKDTLENTFVDLAKTCYLIKNDCKDEISSIVKAIYSYFSDNTLFVFDNTEKILLKKNEKNEFMYLPNYRQLKCNKFMVISQDIEWTTNHFAVKVDRFSDEDADQYLSILSDCTKEEKKILATTFQHWPLALCLAASYINLETKNSLGRKTISDVIRTLQIDNEKFLLHETLDHEMESYTGSLQSLWRLIRNKLLLQNALSIRIIHILSLSEPDSFPLDLLKLNVTSEDQVNMAVSLLLVNSLVTVTDYKISIHRTLQAVIRNSIVSNVETYEDVLTHGIECFSKFLESMDQYDRLKNLGNSHLVAFLHHICKSSINPHKYFNMAYNLLQKMANNTDLVYQSEPDQIFDTVLAVTRDKLGDDHVNTIAVFGVKGWMLRRLEKYEESLNIFNMLIEINMAEFGANDHTTAFSLYCKAIVLDGMGNYKEALDIINRVVSHNSNKLGEFHLDTLTSLYKKARILHHLRKHEDALKILNQVVEKRIEFLGEDHPDTVLTMNDKALVLNNMGHNEEAICIYNKIIDLLMKKVGKNNTETLAAMQNKALALKDLGHLKESLEINNQVIDIASVTLGEKHALTVISMKNKASVLFDMEKYEESLCIFNHVIEVRRERLGDNHREILIFLLHKASVLERMEKYDNALDIYIKIENDMQTVFGIDHPETLMCKANQASVLEKLGKFDQALIMHDHLIELVSENLGKRHPTILTHMQAIASILHTVGRYDEALYKYNQITNEYESTLGTQNETILHYMYMKSVVLFKMKKFDESLHTLNNVIETQTKNFGINHPNTLYYMLEKSAIFDKTAKYEDVLSLYNEIYNLKSEASGKNNTENIYALHERAIIVTDNFENDPYFLEISQTIVEELEKIDTIQYPTFTRMHKNSLVLKTMGMKEESLIILEYLTELQTKILGEEHHETLKSMNDKAFVLVDIGRLEEALNIACHIINVKSNHLGSNNPSTIFSMKNKASILHQMLRYEEALAIYDHIWLVRLKEYGENHTETLKILNNKALVLNDMEEYAEALNIYNHVIEIFSETLDENDNSFLPLILNNKALVLENLELFDEALSIFDQIIKMRLESGKNEHEMLPSLHNKSALLFKLGRYEEALNIYDNQIEICIKYLGANHPETLTIIHDKVSVLYELKRYVEALNIINHVIEMRTEILGEIHSDVSESIRTKHLILERLQKNLKRLYAALYLEN